MKRKLKTLGIIVAAFTAGEFITMWRTQTTPLTLKEFTKNYFQIQAREIRNAHKAGELLGQDPAAGKAAIKKLAFPYITP